jgi:ubiquinone/menaquinone biosynthesis C-methylase UbiE
MENPSNRLQHSRPFRRLDFQEGCSIASLGFGQAAPARRRSSTPSIEMLESGLTPIASSGIWPMKKSVERMARRLVPSSSLLSHNPVFKALVNAADLLPRAIWREFRNLPPNHLRIRIGVGNRFFSNQPFYLGVAESFWLHHMSVGLVNEGSTIVDIGCGCGRFAHHLRDFRYLDTRFHGRYIGIDIDQEMLDWCMRNFDSERFEFLHSSQASKSYKQPARGAASYDLPIPGQTVDFVFSRSLFTHLLEPELKNYLAESFRVLKPGGSMVMSFFCLDHPPPTYGGRHTFRHRIGNAAVESMAVPEAAVAYREAFMVDLARQAGFSAPEVIGKAADLWQPDLIARK